MSVVSRPHSASEPDDRPAGEPRRFLLLAVVRPMLTVAALICVYYLLPVDRRLSGWTLVLLIAELGLVVAVIVWQIRLILRARYPTLQGIEALALSVPLFLLVFANVYYLLEHNVAGSFTAPLSRTDALYFAVTVFTTVGFGDITPVAEPARLLVTGQMVGNLLVIGVALRVILTAVERGRRRKGSR
jgi:voltage-gated potassium channel